MNLRPPMATKTPDGAAYDITAPGVMLRLADTAHGSGRGTTSPAGRANAQDGYEALLDAARAGGYTQTDILHTLLVTGEVSYRVKEMAHAACDAAGTKRIGVVFAAMRWSTANERRPVIGAIKRKADQAYKADGNIWSMSYRAGVDAAARITPARRAELRALRELAKLCTKARGQQIDDASLVIDVDVLLLANSTGSEIDRN